jgi:hypothetical protein
MTQTTHPSKEQVRQFMQRRRVDRTPPPSPDQIRRELGWHLEAAVQTAGAGMGSR